MMMTKYEDKSNGKKILLAILCSMLALFMLTSCGGKDKTLEEYLADNPSEQQSLDQIADASGMEITVKENTVTYVYTYPTTYSEAQIAQIKSGITNAIGTVESTMTTALDSIEKETKIKGVTMKIVYKNGDGSTIYEKEFK